MPPAHRPTAELGASRDDLAALIATLVRFDTTTRGAPGGPGPDTAALQAHLASRLAATGALVDVWEPGPHEVPVSRQLPTPLGFDGLPQLVARLPGRGDGPSLLLLGHVDVAPAGPAEAWTTGPFTPVVRDGHLVGRGAADMKSGVAAMVVAFEAVARSGTELAGDLLLATVTDEESTSAGGVALVGHGVRPDAVVVPEPTGLDVGVACAGSLLPTIRVTGRSGHAGVAPAHWASGGAVDAISKAGVVIDAVRRLNDEWRGRSDTLNPFLSPPTAVITRVHGGEWSVTYPDACTLSCHVSYLPRQADAAGFGSEVEREFTAAVRAAAATDGWLAAHPPELTWDVDVPPCEVGPDSDLVRTLLTASAVRGRPAQAIGTDFWHDGATFHRTLGVPAVTFGPGSVQAAHKPDEAVPLDEVLTCARVLADTALAFCGVAARRAA